MDGLLLDTERMARQTWRDAAVDCGFDLDDDLFLRLIGRTRQDSSAIMAAAIGDAFDAGVFRERCRHHWEALVQSEGIPLKPGVVELLDHLDAVGLGAGVATSTGRASAERSLETAGVRARFSVLVTGDEVERGKPAPDIFLRAAERLSAPPPNCLVLEDSVYGVMAAHAAGAVPVMVPDLVAPTPDVERLAWRVVGSLLEVPALLGHSLLR
jgi:HAD superfamily hydrolase (TIGR01509 family)